MAETPMTHSGRHGFTLIELLVVLGIIIVVGTLGAAAFQSATKINRLAAAEGTIAAALRDARNAARTTGNPVTVQVKTDANGTSTVSGVARLGIWGVAFRPTDFTDAPTDPDAVFGVPADPSLAASPKSAHEVCFEMLDGLTGTAFAVNPAAVTSGDWPAATIYDKASAKAEVRDRRRELTRSTAATEGFVLRCVVRPSTTFNDCQPLVVLSGETPDAPGTPKTSLTAPTMAGAIAGILLRPFSYNTTHQGHAVPVTAMGWDAVGWVAVGGVVKSVSLCEDNRQPDGTSAQFSSSGAPSSEAPLVDWIAARQRQLDWQGGRWREIALLFDGSGISLLIDGRLATTVKPVGGPLPRPDQIRCFLGHLVVAQGAYRGVGHSSDWDRASGSLTWNSGSPTTGAITVLNPDARLAAVDLLRLVEPQPRQLPGGIQVVNGPIDYRVMPSGLVTGTATTIPPLVLTGQFNEAEDRAILTINPASGQVTGELKPSRSAP